jgi:arsenate reductase
MAEALWNHLGKDRWEAFSAGSHPAGFVHPLAVRALGEIGLDLSRNRSKPVSEFAGQKFDLVVTVCDQARDSCPVFPGAAQVLHWPFEDPSHAPGSEEERMPAFRATRDRIAERIRAFLE